MWHKLIDLTSFIAINYIDRQKATLFIIFLKCYLKKFHVYSIVRYLGNKKGIFFPASIDYDRQKGKIPYKLIMCLIK